MILAALSLLAASVTAVDLSGDAARQVVIAAGTETVYQGHPTMTATDAPDHLICVWTDGHAGPCGPASESRDGGKTWVRIDERMPAAYREMINCPSIYRMKGPDGQERLWIFAHAKKGRKLDEMMPRIVSEDDGKTWCEAPPLGRKFRNIMTFASMVRLNDGSYLAMFHKGNAPEDQDGWQDKPPLSVWQTISKDGGFTWSDPTCVAKDPEGYLCPCEPCVFRSPDGKELCCLMRENKKGDSSLVIFSQDEGKTWSKMSPTSVGLTGHRHAALKLADGRIAVMMRSWFPFAGEDHRQGKFAAWVGPYAAIRSASDENAKMYKLLHSYPGGWGDWDCGYPAVSLQPDGTIVAATYIHYRNDKCKNSVVATRFTPLSLAEAGCVRGRIEESARYATNARLEKAFAFLRRADLATLPVGRYEIEGDEVFAMVQECELKPVAEMKVEAHRKYIDIQAPLLGSETLGVGKLSEADLGLPFDEAKDFAFYDRSLETIEVHPGEFVMFIPPYCAHGPGCTSGARRSIKKVVVKVRK